MPAGRRRRYGARPPSTWSSSRERSRRSLRANWCCGSVDDAGTPFRARGRRPPELEPARSSTGSRLRLTGVRAQRASRKGVLDGYRLWIRDAADLIVVAGPRPAIPRSSPSPTGPPVRTPPSCALPTARSHRGRGDAGHAPRRLGPSPDAAGRLGAVELLLPVGQAAPRPGTRLQVDGEIGTAYGAPRVRVASLRVMGAAAVPEPRPLPREPGSGDEGELVRISGRVVDLRRLGDRWRAEVRTQGATIVVAGLAGAGIPAATMSEGTAVSVIGVVRRPHPAAADRRFAVVPRGPADVRASAMASSSATAVDEAGGARPVPTRPAGRLRPRRRRLSVHLPTRSLTPTWRPCPAWPASGCGSGASWSPSPATACRSTMARRPAACSSPAMQRISCRSSSPATQSAPLAASGGPVVRVDDPAGLVHLGDLGEALPLDRAAPGRGRPRALAPSAAALPAPADYVGSLDAAPADAGTAPWPASGWPWWRRAVGRAWSCAVAPPGRSRLSGRGLRHGSPPSRPCRPIMESPAMARPGSNPARRRRSAADDRALRKPA